MRRRSPILLLTLAEFAWLAAFAVLLMLADRERVVRAWRTEAGRATQQEGVDRAQAAEASRKAQELAAQLAALNPNQMEKDRASAHEALNEAQKLRESLDERQKELNSLRASLETVNSEKTRLQADLTLWRSRAADAERKAGQQEGSLRIATGALSQQQKETQNARTALAEQQSKEFLLRQELIGIVASDLGRVVILFDTSSSMRRSQAWDNAKRLVRAWLEHLPIEECVLINFDSVVRTFPPSNEGRYLRLRKSDKSVLRDNLEQLLAHFDTLQGGALTDTLAALQTAYAYNDANMFLLFTDGAPQTRFQNYAQLKPRIFTLIRNQPRRIPINTVGLGDYELIDDDDIKAHANAKIQFLKEVAKATGGSFIFQEQYMRP